MIYLDHNATTPVLPEVFEAMRPWLTEHYGNPSSVHRAGRLARQALDTAREQVASFLGAQAGEVVFTSGGTESDNLALHALSGGRRRYLVGATEHAAVLEAAAGLSRQADIERVVLPVDHNGYIDADVLKAQLEQGAAVSQLVSIMAANNETGTIQDLEHLGQLAREAGALMHTDAVQSAGKIAINFADLPVDLLSISGHKLYAPKGVGALVVRSGVSVNPQLLGGGHEKRRRAGTENLPGIVGLGKAAELAQQQLAQRQQHTRALRDRFEAGLQAMQAVTIFAEGAQRVSNTCQFGLAGFHSEALLMQLDKHGIAVASGSACHAGTGLPSHVLLAMGYDETTAHSAIRVSFGVQNSEQDVEALLAALQHIAGSANSGFAAGLFGGEA